MSFADLGVSRPVAGALRKRGITAPFAIQKLVIEDVLDGDDVLVQSPTGSGKTLAFGIPLVDLIEPDDRHPAALILAPTRELALQIVDSATAYENFSSFGVVHVSNINLTLPIAANVVPRVLPPAPPDATPVVREPRTLEDLLLSALPR